MLTSTVLAVYARIMFVAVCRRRNGTTEENGQQGKNSRPAVSTWVGQKREWFYSFQCCDVETVVHSVYMKVHYMRHSKLEFIVLTDCLVAGGFDLCQAITPQSAFQSRLKN